LTEKSSSGPETIDLIYYKNFLYILLFFFILAISPFFLFYLTLLYIFRQNLSTKIDNKKYFAFAKYYLLFLLPSGVGFVLKDVPTILL